jgi:ankyrin repeat protein
MRAKNQVPMTFERLIDLSSGKDSSSFWRGRSRGLCFENVQRYLDESGDPNKREENGQTLLHLATENGDMEIMKLLLGRGADIDAKGYHGYTALHLAVDADCDTSPRDGRRATNLPLTTMLIGFGADESMRDDDGKMPRDFAVAYGEIETKCYDSIPRQKRQKR